MAEPTTTPPSASAAALGGDGLLATKLHAARPRPGLLARPRLLEHISQGTARELTLICAPAGFGKTALLADWTRGSRRPVAWLSLDQGDRDPARFWRYVAAALDGVRPGIYRHVDGLLRGAQQPLETVTSTVVNELADGDDEVVLVLDDYHLVEAPPVNDSLATLLERLPAQLRVALASRSDPPLPLARLRARGQVTELREADLRFTPDEAAELLRSATGAELPEAAVAALNDRTEGWVAGLQLAALSLRGQADVDGFVAGFSGSHRFVVDYLAEEVLDRQAEPLRTFLLETSILERLSGPLCDAITGQSGSQHLLEQIERGNLFLTPLDEVRGWWRYHQLFADLLRARLQQERPERLTDLHRAAAAWHERHGRPDDAVGHALAAGDAVWAARLIERNYEALLGRSEDATLRRWLEALPPEAAGSRPRLWLAQAFWALLGGRVEAVERLLDEAERAFAAAAAEPFESSVGRDASLIGNVPAGIARLRAAVAHLRGDADQTVAFAGQALAQLGDGEWMLESVTRWYLAVAEWLRGRPAEAERAFTSSASSIAAWRATGQVTLAVWGYHYLGQVQRAQGRLGAAVRTYREALAVAVEPARPVLPAAGIAHVGLAEVGYERDELASALDHATAGVELSRQLGWTLPLVTGLTVLARIRWAQGDQAGALEAVGEAERVGLSPAIVGLLDPLPAVRARLALAGGDVDAAADWVRARGLEAEDGPSYPREREYLVLARVLLARKEPERALGLLDRLSELAAAQARTASVIESRALQALAHAACDDPRRGLAVLDEALALAAPEAYLRVFVDEGPAMAALVRQLVTGQGAARAKAADAVGRDHLASLAAAFERAGAPVFPPARRGAVAVPGVVEPLSQRELEVLRLLADGLPNRAIAGELVVTLDTVKRHVSHLFAKLGVANRTQAVTRAQELGLLR
jgi:LuxR family transcriptional regulator, maltose regulon positive regulatory protein